MMATLHETKLKELQFCLLPQFKYGDIKLNVFPITHKVGPLPTPFNMYRPIIRIMLDHVPYVEGADNHYVTIDSKFFTQNGLLRREGIHIDGNFCAEEGILTWGGIRMKNSVIDKDWELPYDIEIPVGKYVSSDLGGIISLSSLSGCQVWDADYEGEIGEGGSLEDIADQFYGMDGFDLEAFKIYFMSSNTPHASTPIKAGQRRTLVRITLDHRYPNELIMKGGE